MQGGDNQPNEPDDQATRGHIDSHLDANVGEAKDIYQDERSHLEVKPDAVDDAVVTWEASEYIHHQKDSTWYLIFGGVTAVTAIVFYILLRDIFSIIVLVLMAVAVAVYAGRKPQVVRYSLSSDGLTVAGKHYELDLFRTFSVMQEGGVYSVTLMPVRRFMPPVSIYFSPQDGDQIMDILGAVMPHEDREPDMIDRFMRNIRF